MAPGYGRCNDLVGVVCFTRGCQKEGAIHSNTAWNGWSNFRLLLLQGFGGQRPIWTYINNSTHRKYCFLAASQQCGLFQGKPGNLCQEISSCRVSGLRPWAGQERHVFDFPLSLLWLLLSCLLLLSLKVQLLTDQISGLGDQPASEAQHWNTVTQRAG